MRVWTKFENHPETPLLILDTFGGVTFFDLRPNNRATGTFTWIGRDFRTSIAPLWPVKPKKIYKTKLAQHEKVIFWVHFSTWYDHRFQFRQVCASLNEVWKSPRDTPFDSTHLLLNDFFGVTTDSNLDEFARKKSKNSTCLYNTQFRSRISKITSLLRSDEISTFSGLLWEPRSNFQTSIPQKVGVQS